MKHIVYIALFSMFLLSCNHEKEKTTEPVHERLGKYVYVDDNDILHIDPVCLRLRHGNDDKGHEIYAKHPIDTSQFIIKNPEYFRVCSRCVGDKEYERLLRISKRNNDATNPVVNYGTYGDYTSY